jgi:hypothetical protein
MNRILEVTDEDETLVLEYISLEDLKDERIFPGNIWSGQDQ